MNYEQLSNEPNLQKTINEQRTMNNEHFSNEPNFNIKRDDLNTENGITKEHIQNSLVVRKLLVKRNINPQQLPPSEDIKKVERQMLSEQKKLITKA